jgi:hypothetical protein
MSDPTIFHFHLFKNAGTSVDALLRQSFPESWEQREFEGNKAEIKLQTMQWFKTSDNLIAFSSHTAIYSKLMDNVRSFLPIIFVRQPLDRIESVFEFERRQGDNSFGSNLARENDLVDYIMKRNRVDRQCRNFHITRFNQTLDALSSNSLEDALTALNHFPVVGVVDRFYDSMDLYRHQAARLGLSIASNEVHLNTTRETSTSLTERLAKLKERIGTTAYEHLEQENLDDIHLYNTAVLRLERQHSEL